MARPVDSMPVTAKSKYPWDEWFDGRVWELVIGEDIPNVAGFRGTLGQTARARGGTCPTRVRDGKLYIQFMRNGGAT